MANIVEEITKYIPVLDEAYVANCKTAVLDGKFDTKWDEDCKSFKIAKFDCDGTTTYDPNVGYAGGDVKLSWEMHTPNYNQGIVFNIDAIENSQTAGMELASLVGQFEKQKIYGNLDTFRLSTYSGMAKNVVEEDFTSKTGKNVITSLRNAINELENKEIDPMNCICFIRPDLLNLISDMDTTASKQILTELNSFVKVPKGRLITDGEFVEKKGFQANAESVYTNFVILDATKVMQTNLRLLSKVFTPEENQMADGYRVPYHRFEIADVMDNAKESIYVSKTTTKVIE